jgi:hypothetical protein
VRFAVTIGCERRTIVNVIVFIGFPNCDLTIPQSTIVNSKFLMSLSKNAKIRILIAAALVIGWIIVVFFRSGTAWG